MSGLSIENKNLFDRLLAVNGGVKNKSLKHGSILTEKLNIQFLNTSFEVIISDIYLASYFEMVYLLSWKGYAICKLHKAIKDK